MGLLLQLVCVCLRLLVLLPGGGRVVRLVFGLHNDNRRRLFDRQGRRLRCPRHIVRLDTPD
jgi:hypothetical protein